MKSIHELVYTAYKAITVPDLGSARLLPEQADRFVRIVQKASVLLGATRKLTLRNDRRNIDRTGFSARILQAPQAEGAEFTGETEPVFLTNELIAQKVRGRAILSDEALEENIERGNFENTLVDMIAEQAGLDLEELFLAGDTLSGDTFLALTDGWLKKAAQQITGVANVDFVATDVESMFEAMLLAVDDKYFRDLRQWRFYVTFEEANDYRDKLRARGTQLGDSAQTGSEPLFYKGIRVESAPMMPAGNAELTNVDNTVYGIRREIEIEPERVAGKDRWEFHVRAKGDSDFEDENAAVHAVGYTG